MRAGAGGDEAGIFAAELLNLYERYVSRARASWAARPRRAVLRCVAASASPRRPTSWSLVATPTNQCAVPRLHPPACRPPKALQNRWKFELLTVASSEMDGVKEARLP